MKLKLPAGAIVGALISVAILNIVTGLGYMPRTIKIFTQMVSGLVIGSKVVKADIYKLKNIVKPALLAVVILITLCLGMSAFLYCVTSYSLATAAFACAPGGLMDMSLASIDMGADISVVSTLQVFRLVCVLSIFPAILKIFMQLFKVSTPLPAQPLKEEAVENNAQDKKNVKNIAITLLVGVVSGLLGKFIGLPAGILTFAMIGVATQNIVFNNAYMPPFVKKVAQIFAGALIGTSVTYTAVVGLKIIILPMLILLIGHICITLTIATILHKISGLDFTTAFLATAPGGASDLTLVAGDFGADMPTVSIIQIIRQVGVIAFYPIAIELIGKIIK